VCGTCVPISEAISVAQGISRNYLNGQAMESLLSLLLVGLLRSLSLLRGVWVLRHGSDMNQRQRDRKLRPRLCTNKCSKDSNQQSQQKKLGLLPGSLDGTQALVNFAWPAMQCTEDKRLNSNSDLPSRDHRTI
jgi:hypothetical protein